MEPITNEQGFTFSLDTFNNKYAEEKLGKDYKVIKVTKDDKLEGRILFYKGKPYMELPLNIEAFGCKIDVLAFCKDETKK